MCQLTHLCFSFVELKKKYEQCGSTDMIVLCDKISVFTCDYETQQ